jgi:regulatory helix-turn-helix AraC family protein
MLDDKYGIPAGAGTLHYTLLGAVLIELALHGRVGRAALLVWPAITASMSPTQPMTQQTRADLTSPQLAYFPDRRHRVPLGFPSQAHFSRLFRARFGCSPSQARTE